MCGMKMDAHAAKMAKEYEAKDEKPEVEVSVEGDPSSVRSLLEKLVPKK
jgi:hypothetical protein